MPASDYLYHVKGEPELSDGAYDDLFRRLQALDAEHPELVTPDSPTQRVGADPRTDLPTVAHEAPMLSLDSSKDPDELRRFDERIRKGVDGHEVVYVLEPKLDGVPIELVYEDGVLTRAVPRLLSVRGEVRTSDRLAPSTSPRRRLNDLHPP